MQDSGDKNSFLSELRAQLPEGRCELPVLCFESIDSTNSHAKRLLLQGGFQAPALLWTRSQESGRGRQGRSFESPLGGLYFTYVVPREHCKHPDLLTPIVSVALCHALEELFPNMRVGIKWVNDIFVKDRKLAGILCETCGVDSPFIIGIGVNVGASGALIPSEAISLGEFCQESLSLGTLCGSIVRNLDGMLASSDPAALMGEYRERSVLVGRVVTCAWDTDEPYDALVVGISDTGHLLVELADGSGRELFSGDVRVRLS